MSDDEFLSKGERDALRKEIAHDEALRREMWARGEKVDRPTSLAPPAEPAPDRQLLGRMLDDVEAVTKARFYEDPDPIASPVEMFMVRDGREGGETFDQLSGREKWQVLGDYTRWQEYEEHGVGFRRLDEVFRNVIEGKPRERWLEGTGLGGHAAVIPEERRQREGAVMDAVRMLVREQGEAPSASQGKSVLGYDLAKPSPAPEQDRTRGR